jgi:prophage regulatory protein
MPKTKLSKADTAVKAALREHEPADQVVPQPRAARILRRPEVVHLTGLSTSTLYAMMARGEFPRPVRLGRRAVGWSDAVVQGWLAARTEASF